MSSTLHGESQEELLFQIQSSAQPLLNVMNIAEPGSSAYAQQVALELAAEFPDVLTSGRLFDSIRGVESKLRLVETPNALEALTR